ncbi:acetyltransferase [Ectobacillus sp. sgz5001026]|uniref:acetyltransferase n=1 Tax=Ectobacillus sp. sgz5001026 TaxID=3242473 RepID=UPI0036D26CA9
MNRKLLLIGGGGHCKSVLDSILKENLYAEIGIIDKKENTGNSIFGVSVIGCDDDMKKLHQQGFTHAFVTLGSIGNPRMRIKLFEEIERIGFEIPNIIDTTAIISERVDLANGVFVGKNAVINVGSTIGKGAIINTSCTIEHECVIGNFAHIAPGSVLCGEVHIGNYTHVGARSAIKQQVTIGSNTLIGIGSVVLKNIADNVVAYGIPCKEVKA